MGISDRARALLDDLLEQYYSSMIEYACPEEEFVPTAALLDEIARACGLDKEGTYAAEAERIMAQLDRRPRLVSKLQDVYHYLLAATGDQFDPDGRESTFDRGRLSQRIECYARGREGFIEAHDIADGTADGATEDQRTTVLDSPLAQDFKSEDEMRGWAKGLLGILRDWCSTIQVDPYQCLDRRTGRHY